MMMIARLAKSSNVDVGFKEVAMITEILKEMGPETSAKEAELVEKIVKEAKKEVIDPHAGLNYFPDKFISQDLFLAADCLNGLLFLLFSFSLFVVFLFTLFKCNFM